MSKFKTQAPIIHVPSFRTYYVSGSFLKEEIEKLGCTLPMGRLDSQYYYTDLEGWGNILWDLVFNSNLYKADRFDCENYALKAMTTCAERYGLNTMGLVIGDIPLGRHGFNIFFHGDGFMLWEPNDGFSYAGTPFEIGEYGYHPDIVLI